MYYLEELALMGQLDTGRIGRIDGSARTSATPESFPRRSLARSPQPRDPLYPVCSEANHLYEVNAGGVHRAQTVVTLFLCLVSGGLRRPFHLGQHRVPIPYTH